MGVRGGDAGQGLIGHWHADIKAVGRVSEVDAVATHVKLAGQVERAICARKHTCDTHINGYIRQANEGPRLWSDICVQNIA